MRELEFDSLDEATESLIFTDDEGSSYHVALNDALREAISTAAPVQPEATDIAEPAAPRPAPEPSSLRNPRYDNPLTMRPREIQARIRAGASPQQLADEMEVALSRVEGFAYPVLLERQQVASLARNAYPLRDGNPSKATLSELLAGAFATRGYLLSDAHWDAFREPQGEWIVRLSWTAGLAENEAEWILHNLSSTAPTVEPRDAMAADLIDPNFAQPARHVTTVTQLSSFTDEEPEDDQVLDDDTAELEPVPDSADPSHRNEDTVQGDGFLQHPSPDAGPTKRRRKATTPHWEDVLLGVRTNTKRPKK